MRITTSARHVRAEQFCALSSKKVVSLAVYNEVGEPALAHNKLPPNIYLL